MELSDPNVIANLLSLPDGVRRPPTVAGPAAVSTPKRQRAARLARCTCGVCSSCQENARWERIFQEKFADPEYYSPRPIRRGSPLL